MVQENLNLEKLYPLLDVITDQIQETGKRLTESEIKGLLVEVSLQDDEPGIATIKSWSNEIYAMYINSALWKRFQTRMEVWEVPDEIIVRLVEKMTGVVIEPKPKQKSKPIEMSIELPGGVVLELVRVPAGEFTMGSEDGYKNEWPMHKVDLAEYWIGKYPVTNGQYRAYIKKTGVTSRLSLYYLKLKETRHPVVDLTWKESQVFCQWLSEVSGKSICLPTEAQWEKAARGTDGRTYPWGNEKPTKNLCNFGMNVGDTSEVGSYPDGVSPYGALDMTGNMWEWCADWYDSDYYKNAPQKNPMGPEMGRSRVVRGGSFFSNRGNTRTTFRRWSDPVNCFNDRGFRICLSPCNLLNL